MSFVRELAVRIGWLEHRGGGRIPGGELNASYSTGSGMKKAQVRDISPTGVYLYTRDRWIPGTSVELTLRKSSALANHALSSVRLRARSVRFGEDGVGLKFEPDHVGPDTWVRLVLKASDLTAEKDTVQVFRVSKAIAFLRRFSPAAERRVLEHIAGESIYESGDRAVETILRTEELVESWGFPIRTGVDPNLILNLLEAASRTSAEWVLQHWAGMLASSIQHWAKDRESLKFVALLSGLDPVQVRILDAACSRALRAEREVGYASPRGLTCGRETMRSITGTTDLAKVERHLDRLCSLDLLEQTVKFNSFEPIEQANLCPTRAGLALYARCRGLLQPPEISSRPHGGSVIPFQAPMDDSDFERPQPDRFYAPASNRSRKAATLA